MIFKKTNPYRTFVALLAGLILSGNALGFRIIDFQNHIPLQEKQQMDSLFDVFSKFQHENPKKAKQAAEMALKRAENSDDTKNIARSYYSLGVVSYTFGNYDEAINYLTEGLQNYQILDDLNGICLCYKWLGNVYNELNQVKEGMSCLTKSLEIAQEIGWEEEIFKINNNIGISFLIQEHYPEAITHFKAGINYDADTISIVRSLTNLGLAYESNGDLEKAGELYFRSMEYCSEDDENCLLMPLTRMIHYYYEMEEYEKSIEVCFRVLDIAEPNDMKNDIMITTNSIGLSNLNLGNYDEAIKYFKQTAEIAKEINESELYMIYANLSYAYEGKKDYKRSYEYLNLVSELKDSIFNAEKNQQIEELMVKYENEKKENEILQLKQEKELQETEISKQQLIRNFILGVAFLILLSALITVFIYQQKIRDKNLLAQKTEEVNKQRILDMLHAHEIDAIKASISGQEKAKKEIAKELHDNIAGALAGIKMKLGNLYNNYPDSQLNRSISNLDQVYQDIRMLSHHLIPPRILNTSFTELIRKYVDEISGSNTINIDLILHPEEDLNALEDEVKVEIYRIVQELLNNIIKHAKADMVEIQIIRTVEKINMLIEDDGIGFDQHKVRNGIGISNITSRVKVLNGTIDIDSVEGRGTIFNIEIPVI